MEWIRRGAVVLGMCAAMTSPVVFSGCSGRVTYYDASYSDYHPWNHDEVVWYGRWEQETHRPHLDYRRRSADEQREYWKWRHSEHPDRH